MTVPNRAEAPARDLAASGATRGATAPAGWPLVAGLVAGGLLLCLTLTATVAHMHSRPRRIQEQGVDEELLSAALHAYQRQDWDEAERRFEMIRTRYPDNTRAQDFLDRIELTRRDAERLARAEEALVAGQFQQAEDLAARVAPNSALFAQAETLARNARKAREAAGSLLAKEPVTAGAAYAVGVRAALGEAIALYEHGKFEQAASRADGLVRRAAAAARPELTRWAQEARDFATLYAALPSQPDALLTQNKAARQAIELDERLAEGHYARGIRLRLSDAIMSRADVLFEGSAIFEACVMAREAKDLRGNERRVANMERRCDAEAMRRVGLARGMERDSPDEARTLYEQALSLASQGSSAARAAEQALSVHGPDSRAKRAARKGGE